MKKPKKRKIGRPPIGRKAMTATERKRRQREREANSKGTDDCQQR
jgi:hypothetical protein